MKKFHALMLALGLGFVIYLIHKIGIRELWNELMLLGWGLVPLVLSEGVAELFHAISWRYCLSGPQRSIPFLRLFRMSMAGYAISYLTPTASIGGDVTRAGLLALNHKGPEAITGVLISKLSFALAHLFIVILGSILMRPQTGLPPAFRSVLLITSSLIALGIIIFLWLQRQGKLGVFMRWLVARNIGGKTLRSTADHINHVDETLKTFYRERPSGLPLAVFWHLLGYGVGVFQVWYFLHLLVHDSRAGTAATAWFLGMWFDLLSFAVPTNVGVLEGTRTVAFRTVGYEPLLGMTFAVALRVAQLFWAAFGLASYASLISTKTFRTNRLRSKPRWQPGVTNP